MRKSSKIAVAYLLIVSLILALCQLLILNIPLKSVPETTWLFRLADLEQRLHRYRFSSSPIPVVVGTSYASQLGEFADVKNVAVRSSNLKDHENLIHLCRAEDTILYLCTIRESVIRDEKPHDFIAKRWVRKQIILKQLLLTIFGALEPDSASSARIFHPSDPEYSVLCDSLGIDDLSTFHTEYLLWQIRSIAHTPNPVDVAAFARLCETFPNMIIVLHPALPLREVPNTGDFARQINAVAHYQTQWESQMQQSGLPVYNLSSTIAAQHFVDLNHLTEGGQSILKQQLLALLLNIERINIQ